jgi:hypothetical protein
VIIMTPTPTGRRLSLRAADFAPVPLNGKTPEIAGWQRLGDATEHEIIRWEKTRPAHSNTGILTRRTPGYDIDILDEECAAAIERMLRERYEDDNRFLVRFGRWPKRLIPFRTDEPFDKIAVALIAPDGAKGQKIEVLCDGQQFVCFGVHPETGQEYVWFGGEPGEVKREELPSITAAEAREIVAAAVEIAEQHGYRREPTAPAKKRRPNGAGAPTNWFIDYSDHDQVAAQAMRFARSGMIEGAAYNCLYDHINALPDSPQKTRRLSQLSNDVATAYAKIAAEAAISPPVTAPPPPGVTPPPPGVTPPPPPPGASTSPPAVPLPVIQLTPGEIPRIVAEIEAAVLASESPVFSRAGALVRPLSEAVPAADGGKTVSARLSVFTPDSFNLVVASSANFTKFNQRRRRWVPTDPPIGRVRDVLAHEEWPFPRVSGVITTPTLRPDGSLLDAPGYDPATELYLMSSVALPPIPVKPTRAEALTALAELKDLLSEFWFTAALDRSVAITGLLTTLLRGVLPATPMILVTAGAPGVGKSYLVNLISAIVTGRACPAVSLGRNTEEAEKRIAAILLGGSQIASFDNLARDLDDELLCQASEQRVVGVRPFGRLEKVDCENRTQLFGTGNNVSFAGDMCRRGLTCGIEAREERPELRTFRHNARRRAYLGRAGYIAAAFTIIRAHIAANMPNGAVPIGSYEKWSIRVRDPLMWLGEPDPVDSMKASRDADPVLGDIRELWALWPKWLQLDVAYATTEIIKAAQFELRAFLLRVAESRKPGEISPERLGRWLKRNSGRPVGSYRLARDTDPAKNVTTFKLVKA